MANRLVSAARILVSNRTTVANRFLIPNSTQKSLQFNGSSDLATVPITPLTTGWCFSLWLDPMSAATNSSILAYVNNTNGGFKLYRTVNQNVGFYIKNGTTSVVDFTSLRASVMNGKFTNLVVTFAPNNLKFYITNTQVTSDTSCEMTDPDVAQTMTLGRNSFGASAFANVRIKNFTFQNTATPWTTQQITDLYWRNMIPSGAFQWSMNDVATDQNGENGLTLTGTSYSNDVPSHMTSRSTV